MSYLVEDALLGEDSGLETGKPQPPPEAFRALPPRHGAVDKAFNRVTHHMPACPQNGEGTNKCDIMGQTATQRFFASELVTKNRTGEDYFFLGARPGEYGKAPLISPGVAGSPAAAIVPMPGAFDASMMMQNAAAYAAESKRAALYSNEMLNVAKELYGFYRRKLRENFRWKPKVSGVIGAEHFPLY
mmetsp:Transcript_5095/g.12875  ORF Transcript_5095/g.12875 Transcript_5095/m.12875 type:complete len:187 (+) Transcript_5095:91-651(+)|eukprot:CAMPEP_0178993328 /NCGR_PEP_ID=MMETSP0795-20121207/6643_1 /TAXON_ID=88552 /ORGANISM="Amoebophrya sp., Strain Ameob2" /LENGTH=186 /DNA_ID=CAMNT_0020685377 /DNA_START=51 /DNA_END=611 /DNA_ORIENTATION=-